MNVYEKREQTQAKHFILRRYLQELAFKILRGNGESGGRDIAYVDGFSGPWESRTSDFSDTSFMIAIKTLKDAQTQIFNQTGQRRRIKCFFSENNPAAYKQLCQAVQPFHKPDESFEVVTYFGKFEDAVAEIRQTIGGAFPLIFIDPTGWTGYPFDKIKPIFSYAKCEVLINFMYDFVNRFVASEDESTIASLDPILGGPGWRARLDPSLPRGAAVEKLFRETLAAAGEFAYVVSTKVDKSTTDRPHFFLAYGTKNRNGLKAFRETEYVTLREHARNRADAKERQKEERTKTGDLFAGVEAAVQEAGIDQIVEEQMKAASQALVSLLAGEPERKFSDIVDILLQKYVLRETNVKSICVQLARDGRIANTWGNGNRRPSDDTIIRAIR